MSASRIQWMRDWLSHPIAPGYHHSIPAPSIPPSNQKSFPVQLCTILFEIITPFHCLKLALALIVPRLIAVRSWLRPHTRDPACNPGPMGQMPQWGNAELLQARESFDVLPPRTSVTVGMTLMQPDTRIDYAGLSGHLASHTFLFKFHLFSTKCIWFELKTLLSSLEIQLYRRFFFKETNSIRH